MSLAWRGIVIHHSLTDDGGTVSWDAIRRFHTDPNGPPQYRMREIGYHAGIEMIGGAYECLFGRPLDWYGAHTVGLNQTHLGFLFVGNFDKAAPEDEMLRMACERVLRPWMKAFDIQPHQVVPHRDFAQKSCPGRMFDMGRLMAALSQLPDADK